jgi:hypothetical protein
MKRILGALAAALALAVALPTFAGTDGGDDMRWNKSGPAWYETKCGIKGLIPGWDDVTTGRKEPCAVLIPMVDCPGGIQYSHNCPSWFKADARKEENPRETPARK